MKQNMRKAKLSIIVPVFNAEKYLRPCLESVTSQKYNDCELLLIDDGSTDDSGKICDEYARFDNVSVFHTENRGVSHARNTGIDNAEGKYIYFLDGDDIMANGSIRYMIETAEKDPGYVVRFRSRNVLSQEAAEAVTGGRIEKISDKERICSYACGGHIFQFLIPVEILGKHRFNESFSLGEDVLFLSELLPQIDRVIDCDTIIYYRLLREGSAVHSDIKKDHYFDLQKEYHIIKENLSSVEGGLRVYEAIQADQTGAIQKISRNYKEQADNIKKARNMIRQTFPGFLFNPWLKVKTRAMLLCFLTDPGFFFKVYKIFKKP